MTFKYTFAAFFLLLSLVSCGVRKDRGGGWFGSSYRYRYLDGSTAGDSVLVKGKVLNHGEFRSGGSLIAEFILADNDDGTTGEYAWCNARGEFEITLLKGNYDFYIGNTAAEAGFWLRNLGRSGNRLDLRVVVQKREVREGLEW